MQRLLTRTVLFAAMALTATAALADGSNSDGWSSKRSLPRPTYRSDWSTDYAYDAQSFDGHPNSLGGTPTQSNGVYDARLAPNPAGGVPMYSNGSPNRFVGRNSFGGTTGQ